MATTARMHETQNYSLYDQEFLRLLDVTPKDMVSIKNPVSENLKHLVTSLVPHLLKNVHTNVHEYTKIRFFEWGRIWHELGQTVIEQRALSGILFDKSNVDFFEAKSILTDFFKFLGIEVTWVAYKNPEESWFSAYQTAHLMVGEQCIGTAGSINKSFLHTIMSGDAFIFELDGDFLLTYNAPAKKFVALAKYPSIGRDISILISSKYTAHALCQKIKNIDAKITGVDIIDFFEKPEWHEQRAITFRFTINDPEKTLTKEEADSIWNAVANMLKEMGATIR